MKSYTFSFDNNNSKNTLKSIPSTNYSAIIDDIIRANIKKANPYLFEDTATTSSINILPTRSRTIDIDITLPKKSTITIAKHTRNTYDDFIAAVNFLSNFDFAKDDYDFELPDGTPVKIFADEIQIGYDLIPLNKLTKALYDTLSENARKNIIDIYIEINKK